MNLHSLDIAGCCKICLCNCALCFTLEHDIWFFSVFFVNLATIPYLVHAVHVQ